MEEKEEQPSETDANKRRQNVALPDLRCSYLAEQQEAAHEHKKHKDPNYILTERFEMR